MCFLLVWWLNESDERGPRISNHRRALRTAWTLPWPFDGSPGAAWLGFWCLLGVNLEPVTINLSSQHLCGTDFSKSSNLLGFGCPAVSAGPTGLWEMQCTCCSVPWCFLSKDSWDHLIALRADFIKDNNKRQWLLLPFILHLSFPLGTMDFLH